MRRKPVCTAACVLTTLVLVLAGCDAGPTAPEPCAPFAFGLTPPGAALPRASLLPVLKDAAKRVTPVLVHAGATQQLEYAVQAVSAGVYSGDREATCRAFNDALTQLSDFSLSAPPATLPDLMSLRLALSLTRAWVAAPAQP